MNDIIGRHRNYARRSKGRHHLDTRFDRISPKQRDSSPESPEISRKHEQRRHKRIKVRLGRRARR